MCIKKSFIFSEQFLGAIGLLHLQVVMGDLFGEMEGFGIDLLEERLFGIFGSEFELFDLLRNNLLNALLLSFCKVLGNQRP